MKRSIEADDGSGKEMKKMKPEDEITETAPALVLTDENLLHEVLKYVDARSLATASCVNKQWHRTAQDERLWELICTRHLANIGCGKQQLRSVVLALGGFRRLHSLYLLPLSKPSSSNSTWPCLSSTAVVPAKSAAGGGAGAGGKTRWGKDEVHLSLSLLSIRYYEKMNSTNRGKGL